MESIGKVNKKIVKKPMKTPCKSKSENVENPVIVDTEKIEVEPNSEDIDVEDEIEKEMEDNEEKTDESVPVEFKIEMESFEHTLKNGRTYKIDLTSEQAYSISLREHIHHGEIYLIHNKKNRKIYIGQAQCFASKDNKRWGTFGRWKSHLNETFNATKDHCKKLNNAIRKYKPESFEVFMLVRVPMEDIDEMEIYLIDYFDSMGSYGYNMRTGGKKGKDSDETRICKSESKQIRPRNFSFVPEPILGGTEVNYETPEMIAKINKKIYRIERDRIQNDLIFPIVENKKILGYRVEGLIYKGSVVLPRDFIGCTNRWNLDQALRFIEQIEYYDQFDFKIKNPHTIDLNYRHKNQSDGYYLPEYLQIHTSPYGVSGFKINGFPSSDYKSGKITKTFVDKDKTKNQNYEDAIDYLEGLKNGTIQHKKRLDMEKPSYNGIMLPDYLSPIYAGKKEGGKIRGFTINRFPKADGTRVGKNFVGSKYESLDKAFEEALKEINCLHKEKKDSLAKK
jgi:hypothetical protein